MKLPEDIRNARFAMIGSIYGTSGEGLIFKRVKGMGTFAPHSDHSIPQQRAAIGTFGLSGMGTIIRNFSHIRDNEKEAKMASKIKEKYGFYLRPETTELIDSHLELSQQKSRSAFVDEAIQHYCCYLDTDHNRILGVEIIRVIRDTIIDQINRVAHMLFKIAVEMSVNNYLRASENPRLKEADYIRLREYAADQVRKNRGWISLESALDDKNVKDFF